jgi:hypothetical protein
VKNGRMIRLWEEDDEDERGEGERPEEDEKVER